MTNAQHHGCKYEGWQCFHCGEVFTTYGGARDHFGAAKGTTPGCLLRVQLGGERGWLMDFRAKEARIEELEAALANAIQSGDENQAQIPDAILERDKLKDENARLKEQLEQQAKMLDYYRSKKS